MMEATTEGDSENFEAAPGDPEQAVPVPPPGPRDEDGEAQEEMSLSREQRHARWQSRKPGILHLSEGVTVTELDGETTYLPLFDVGSRIVVEIRTSLLKGSPWLETLVGKVRSIDDEAGLVSILDEDTDARLPAVRWVSFKDGLHDFRLAPARGNPFDAAAAKRIERELAKAAAIAAGQVKRGRGRPPGSRNRPKEVIQAEKEARKAEKRGK
jgi:hypothetical protein